MGIAIGIGIGIASGTGIGERSGEVLEARGPSGKRVPMGQGAAMLGAVRESAQDAGEIRRLLPGVEVGREAQGLGLHAGSSRMWRSARVIAFGARERRHAILGRDGSIAR